MVLAAAGAIHAQPLPVDLTEDSVLVSNIPAGGTVALFAGQRWRVGFSSQLRVTTLVAADEDSDGVVEFPLDGAPAPTSIWLAVDATTGRFGAASPAEGAPFQLEPGLGLGGDASADMLIPRVDGPPAAHLLLVRHGEGIWIAQAVDGGLAENTGLADGRTLWLDPEWEALTGGTAAPGAYRPSDLLIAVDASSLSYDAGIFGGLNELP